MSNLYQDAILDAKALRASAMANAKAALEEAFEPKIQEMISKKLAEEADGLEEIEEALDEKDEAVVEEAEHADDHKMEESEGINEAELEEILSQLEELEKVNETEATLNEKAEEENEGIVKEEEEEETEEVESEEEETKEAPEGDDKPAPSDDTEVIELSVGQLKDILMSVEAAKQSMAGNEMPPTEEPNADTKADAGIASAGLDLDEILDELEMEAMQKPGDVPQEEGLNEAIIKEVSIDPTLAVEILSGIVGSSFGIAILQKLFPKLANKLGKLGSAASSSIQGGNQPGTSSMKEEKYEMEEAKHKKEDEKELKEAKATIETLRKDLQEVNLLNAKYLYMNKLFKSKSLTESEKVKVINALDRATNVKEVKITYETLKESFEKKKETIKESIGFASKPAGVAPKANIVEADQFISRWQKLAGIK